MITHHTDLTEGQQATLERIAGERHTGRRPQVVAWDPLHQAPVLRRPSGRVFMIRTDGQPIPRHDLELELMPL